MVRKWWASILLGALLSLYSPLGFSDEFDKRICSKVITKFDGTTTFSQAYQHLLNSIDQLGPKEKHFLMTELAVRVEEGNLQATEHDKHTLREMGLLWSAAASAERDFEEGSALYDIESAKVDLKKAFRRVIDRNYVPDRSIEDLLKAQDLLERRLAYYDRELIQDRENKIYRRWLTAKSRDLRLDGRVRWRFASLAVRMVGFDAAAVANHVFENHQLEVNLIDRDLTDLMDAMVEQDQSSREKISFRLDRLRGLTDPTSIDYVLPVIDVLSSMKSISHADRILLQNLTVDLRIQLEALLVAARNPLEGVLAGNTLIRLDPLRSQMDHLPQLLRELEIHVLAGDVKPTLQILFRLTRSFDLTQESLLLRSLTVVQKAVRGSQSSFKRKIDQDAVSILIESVFRAHSDYVHDRRDVIAFMRSISPHTRELRVIERKMEEIGGEIHDVAAHREPALEKQTQED